MSLIRGPLQALALVAAAAVLAPASAWAQDPLVCAQCVDTGDIADQAVTGNKLAQGSILTGKYADQSVTGNKIAQGAILAGKLANGAVRTGKIALDAVTFDRLAPEVRDRIPPLPSSDPVIVNVDCSLGDSI